MPVRTRAAVKRAGDVILDAPRTNRQRRFPSRECIICNEEKCLTEFEDNVTSDCRHARDVCRYCMARTITTEIESKGVSVNLRCLSPGCDAELSLSDVARETSQDVAAKLDGLLLQRALSGEESFCWCAHADCGAGQFLDDLGPNLFMTCQKCAMRTCTYHRCAWHPEQSCAEFDRVQQKAEEEQLHAYLVDNSKLKATSRGLAFRHSPELSDKAKGKFAAWGSIVRGFPANGEWIRVGCLFLPIKIEVTRVLRPQQETYHLDNSILKSKKSHIRYRTSANMNDKGMKGTDSVKWGSFVQGVPLGESWIRVGSLFLPVHVRGVRILRVQTGLEIFLHERGIKRCPKCRQGIEQMQGCDHMKCPCGAEFCYLCGANYLGGDGIFNNGNHMHSETCRHYRVWSQTA